MENENDDKGYDAGLWVAGKQATHLLSTTEAGTLVYLHGGCSALIPPNHPDSDRALKLPLKVLPPRVPLEVTLSQARTLLRREGLFDLVNDAIHGSGNSEMVDAWEYGNGLSRDSAILIALAGALGLNDDDIDRMFIAAAAIHH